MYKIITIFIGINFLLLAGCSTNAPETTVRQAGTLTKLSEDSVRQGTVTKVDKVVIQGKKSSTGRTVGSVSGSLIGLAVPFGSLVGSLIGGVVGGEAEKSNTTLEGLEITLKLDDNEEVVVTQFAETSFKTGDKAQLIIQNSVATVAHL